MRGTKETLLVVGETDRSDEKHTIFYANRRKLEVASMIGCRLKSLLEASVISNNAATACRFRSFWIYRSITQVLQISSSLIVYALRPSNQ